MSHRVNGRLNTKGNLSIDGVVKLASPKRVHLYKDTNQAITEAAGDTLDWDVVQEEVGDWGIDLVSTPDEIVIPAGVGAIYIQVQATWEGGAEEARLFMSVTKNGAGALAGSEGLFSVRLGASGGDGFPIEARSMSMAMGPLPVAPNDIMRVSVSQAQDTTTTDTDIIGTNTTYIRIVQFPVIGFTHGA